MTIPGIFESAIALPLDERVRLAEKLWESIGEDLASPEDAEVIALARRRSKELISGGAVGRTHDEVMETARRALECG